MYEVKNITGNKEKQTFFFEKNYGDKVKWK